MDTASLARITTGNSTNPLKRLNAEIKRRTNVVAIFPNDPATTRQVGAMLLEQNDEWQLQLRYMSVEALRSLSGNQPARLSAVVSRARVQPLQDSRLIHHFAGRDRADLALQRSQACK